MTENTEEKKEQQDLQNDAQVNEELAPAEEVAESEVAAEEVEVVSEEDQVKQLEGRLLRLRADFDNFRKRTDRDKENWSRLAVEKVIHDIIPVVDNFDLGLQNAEQHEAKEAVRQGFQMVYEQLNSMLKKHGIEPIKSVGEVFDPDIHEALTYAPSGEVPEGHIVFEQNKGYMLGDKLIRAAKVVVSSGLEEGEA